MSQTLTSRNTLPKHPMHQTRIDIPEADRVKLIALLNQSLAAIIDLKLQVKQAHWNVKGIHFIALHELFDQLAEELEVHTDTVAERAATLGGVAQGNLTSVYSNTILEDSPLDTVNGVDHLKILIDRYARVAKQVREQIDACETLGDKDSADIFTGVSRSLDLRLWFLEAHLQDKKHV